MSWFAGDLLKLHDGDFDELLRSSLSDPSISFTPAITTCCRNICSSKPVPSRQTGPSLAEVKEQQPSGLGSLMVSYACRYLLSTICMLPRFSMSCSWQVAQLHLVTIPERYTTICCSRLLLQLQSACFCRTGYHIKMSSLQVTSPVSDKQA